MAKLYFKYGAMGSSKSAQALITKFNYEELGMSVWLIKPSIDTRDGKSAIRSRIGLQAQVQMIAPDVDVYELFARQKKDVCDVIIVDECQFMTMEQIDQVCDDVTQSLLKDFEREVDSAEIGERVMAALRKLDQVAYVRFASVYRQFQDAKDFISEVKGLKR